MVVRCFLFCLVPDNEIITSFSNPNYTLNSVDALNSNSLPPSHQVEYYETDDNGIYETIEPTRNCSTTYGQKYGENNTTTSDNINNKYSGGKGEYNYITSPVESEGHFSMDSTATTPGGDQTDSIVSVEHTEQHDTDDESPYAETMSSGFHGYYSNFNEKASDVQNRLLQQPSRETGNDGKIPEKTPLLMKDQKSRLQLERYCCYVNDIILQNPNQN